MAHLHGKNVSDDFDDISMFNVSDQTHCGAINCSTVFRENVTSAQSNDDYSYNYTYYDEYFATPKVAAIVLTIFGLILLVGIVCNILVLVVIATVKSMHTTVNKCLFSLAVTDLIILVFLPIGPIVEEFGYSKFPYGHHFCNLINLIDRGPLVCPLLIFIYVTMDRYYTLFYPLKSRRLWTGRRTYLILAVIWILSCTLSIPYILASVYEVEEYQNSTFYYCYWDWKITWMRWYDMVIKFVVVVTPIPLLFVCYGRMIHQLRASVRRAGADKAADDVSGRRGRIQVVILLLSVVIIFVVSQVPLAVAIFLDHAFPSVFSLWPYDKNTFIIMWTFRLLIYINSAPNPVIYFSLSTNFRSGFKELLCCRHRKRRQRHTQMSSLGSVRTGDHSSAN